MVSKTGNRRCDGWCVDRKGLVSLDGIETFCEGRNSMGDYHDLGMLKITRNLVIRPLPEKENVRQRFEKSVGVRREGARTHENDVELRQGARKLDDQLDVDASFVQ